MDQTSFINFNISTGSYGSFLSSIVSMAQKGRSATVCVANVHMFIEAYRDRSFLQVVNQADLVTPDGQPLTWGLRMLYGIRQERVAGMDLLPDLLQVLSEQHMPVYFYGGSQDMLESTRSYLGLYYSGLQLAGMYSPPFRSLTEEEERETVNRINASGARVVFVVLGCPKQERWMARMKGRINAVMIGIGGALPVMVGIQKRAPVWMQKNGLEWLYRLLQEPKRLFRRYAITNVLFIYVLSRSYIMMKVMRKSYI